MYVDRSRRAGLGGLVALAIAAAVATLPHVLDCAERAAGANRPRRRRAAAPRSRCHGRRAPAPSVRSSTSSKSAARRGRANLVVATVQTPAWWLPNVPNGLYLVRVRAANVAGVSGPSNEISVQVGCVGAAGATGGPGRAGRPATPSESAWQPSAGATGYVLEAGSGPGSRQSRPWCRSAPRPGDVGAGRHLLRAGARRECLRHERAVERDGRRRRGAPPARRPPRPERRSSAASTRPSSGTCSGRDARQVGRRWRRRLLVPHLASADRSLGLRLRATSTATTRRSIEERRRFAAVAGAVRLHRPPAPDAGRAQRPRGAARRLQGVHRQPRRRQRRGPGQPRLLALGVPHGHRRPEAVQHAAPLGRDPPDPSGVRPEGVHPADDEHRRSATVCDPRVRGADQGRRAAELAVPADQRLRDLGHRRSR